MSKNKPKDSNKIKRLTATVHPDAISFLEGCTVTKVIDPSLKGLPI